MTKRVKILSLSGAGLMTAAALTAAIVLYPPGQTAAAPPSDVSAVQTIVTEQPPSSVTEAPEDAAYLLLDLDGFIAVYRLPDMDKPDRITGIDTRTLRRADRLSLQDGIRVEGWENLQKALEDFGP